MDWTTDFNSAEAADLQSPAAYNMFVDAINLRLLTGGYPALEHAGAGDCVFCCANQSPEGDVNYTFPLLLNGQRRMHIAKSFGKRFPSDPSNTDILCQHTANTLTPGSYLICGGVHHSPASGEFFQFHVRDSGTTLTQARPLNYVYPYQWVARVTDYLDASGNRVVGGGFGGPPAGATTHERKASGWESYSGSCLSWRTGS
ncbi:MAG TPA: hypothetical protein VGB55_02520 [Tepidisphaeraceae bacterium]|jgi:hypothetical protein